MRAGWVAVAAVLAGLSDRVAAQDSLPNGLDVSRPLTPVLAPDEPPPEPGPVARVEEIRTQKYTRRGPLGPGWDSFEFLLWWPRAHPLPPVATGTRGGAPPVLGDPNTALLVGGHSIGAADVAGGRFTLGCAANEAETVGVELVYFFLGTRTHRATFAAGPRLPALGLPYFNASTGSEDAFAVAQPGWVSAATTTRVQGAEANAVASLVEGKALRLNGLVGYRFLQVHEGLSVSSVRRGSDLATTYDEFSAHNRFHGGQLGLHADIGHGLVFCELTGKVAFGQTYEVVRVDGASRVAGRVVPGGVYALPTNIGRAARGVFAVAPEGTFRIGLRLTDAGRFYVGYNFLYLSDAVRPGDQLDRVVNPSQVAALGGGPAGPDRPRPVFARSEFWVQGLVIGLETRY